MKKEKNLAVRLTALMMAAFTALTLLPADAYAGSGTAREKWSAKSGSYTVTIYDAGNGAVTFADYDGDTHDFAQGDTVALVVEPDDGYELENFAVESADGEDVEYTETEAGYEFTMPAQDVDVLMEFAKSAKSSILDLLKDASKYGGTSGTDSSTPADKTIVYYETDEDLPTWVTWDTDYDDIVKALPEEIDVVLADGTETTLAVTWECPGEEAYRENPEAVLCLYFHAVLPDGYTVDTSAYGLKGPAYAMTVEDPDNVAAMTASADGVATVDNNSSNNPDSFPGTLYVNGTNGEVWYGGDAASGHEGTYTTYFYITNGYSPLQYDRTYAYCATPAAATPEEGRHGYVADRLDVGDLTDNPNAAEGTIWQIASIIWYGYGGPGYDRDADYWPDSYPDANGNYQPMTDDMRLVLTHIMLADTYTYDSSTALDGTYGTFRDWVNNTILSSDPGSLMSKMRVNAFTLDGDDGSWPDGFTVYEVKPIRSGDQVLLTYLYNPSVEPEYADVTASGNASYTPEADINVTKLDKNTNKPVAECVFNVTLDGDKIATLTTDSKGKASYSWTGTTLTGPTRTSTKTYCTNYDKLSDSQKAEVDAKGYYHSEADAQNAADDEVNDAVDDDLASLKDTEYTLSVEETKVPDGYQRVTDTQTKTIKGTTTTVTFTFKNPETGRLQLQKVSADETLTKNNNCYSLKGAVYGVYEDYDEAAAATADDPGNLATDTSGNEAKLTTDKNGKSNTLVMLAGTYYVKELTASDGYYLCGHNNTRTDDGASAAGVHTVKVTQSTSSSQVTTFTCKEVPVSDPFALQMQKMDGIKYSSDPYGTSELGGAIFCLEYYDNTDNSTSGTPDKKWYFKTDETGWFNCRYPETYAINTDTNKAYTYTMHDGTKLTSDAFYYNAGGTVEYPLGTYRIYEVSPPQYYTLEGNMWFNGNGSTKKTVTTGLTAVVRQDENGGGAVIYDGSVKLGTRKITTENLKISAYEIPQTGSITLYKYADNGSKTPVEGAEFSLKGVNDSSCDKERAYTDSDGKIVFDNLYPDTYIITEKATGKTYTVAYSLLADNVELSVPIAMTADEAKASGADLSKAVFDEASQKYCFYSQTLEVGETFTVTQPMTGADPKAMAPMFAVSMAAVLGGVTFAMKRRRKPVNVLPGGAFTRR